MSGFGCVVGIDWIIVVYNFVLMIKNVGMNINGWNVIVWFKIGKIGVIDNLCYDFLYIVGFFIVYGDDFCDFIGIIFWGGKFLFGLGCVFGILV